MKQFSVISWNVWLKENPHNLAEFLLSQNADIICCQEIIKHPDEDFHRAEMIAKKLGYFCSYLVGDTWDNRAEKSELGNAIFSRFPIISTKKVFLKSPVHNPSKAYFEGRNYLEVEIEIFEKIFHIATTHLSYMDRFSESPDKIKEFENLLPYLQNRENYILCGDFNLHENSQIIAKILSFLQNSGPDFAEKTWTTKPFKYDDFQETELNWRLDHIFASHDMKYISSEIIKTDLSDHLPIKTVFEI